MEFNLSDNLGDRSHYYRNRIDSLVKRTAILEQENAELRDMLSSVSGGVKFNPLRRSDPYGDLCDH